MDTNCRTWVWLVLGPAAVSRRRVLGTINRRQWHPTPTAASVQSSSVCKIATGPFRTTCRWPPASWCWGPKTRTALVDYWTTGCSSRSRPRDYWTTADLHYGGQLLLVFWSSSNTSREWLGAQGLQDGQPGISGTWRWRWLFWAQHHVHNDGDIALRLIAI